LQSDTEKFLAHAHFKAEGDVEFRALLYVPERAPYNFLNDYYGSRVSLKLYVRRVFISDDFDELIPRCPPACNIERLAQLNRNTNVLTCGLLTAGCCEQTGLPEGVGVLAVGSQV
jgi:hypothetical protein